MTAETDLLPLPPLWICPNVEPADFPEVAKALIDYARANVAHATAPLQAEIEALRAEAEQHLQQAMSNGAKARAAQARADNLRAEVATWEGLHASEVQVRQRWQARAEQLAEALREIANQGPHYGPDGTRETWRHWADIARAALSMRED